MFSLHHEMKLKVLLHYEGTHIQRFFDDVLFKDVLLIYYFYYSINHVADTGVSKHGCCRQP